VALFDAKVDVDDVHAILSDLDTSAQDLSDEMAAVSEMFVAAVSDRYESEGDGQWDELKESTVARRRKGSGGVKILQDTGVMAGSTEAAHGSMWAEAATGVEYAIHHVYGAPRANIPQRNPFEIDERYFEEAADIILAGVIGQ
jgi:phage gpG-like protein